MDTSDMGQLSPSDFVQKRRELIAEFILCVPEDKRDMLRDLQNDIDNIIAPSGSPMVACAVIFGEISQRLCELALHSAGTTPLDCAHAIAQRSEQRKKNVTTLD